MVSAMRDVRRVLVAYDDDLGSPFETLVIVDGVGIADDELDEQVFFYFNSVDELLDAYHNGTSLGWQIVEVYNGANVAASDC